MKPSTKRKLLAAGGALLFLLLAVVAWVFRADAQVAHVQELRRELSGEAARNLPPEQRRQKWETLRQEIEKLMPQQREQVFEEDRKKREDELERYFTLSKEEKIRYLDAQINRMEEWRKRAQQNRGQERGGPTAGPPRPGGPQSGGAGQRPNLSPEQREQRRKQRLDKSTPEQRARRDQFSKDMQARRAQRGLPPLSFGFGRR